MEKNKLVWGDIWHCSAILINHIKIEKLILIVFFKFENYILILDMFETTEFVLSEYFWHVTQSVLL
jgi:hypothetical protein